MIIQKFLALTALTGIKKPEVSPVTLTNVKRLLNGFLGMHK
jgi:hypothetical protein